MWALNGRGGLVRGEKVAETTNRPGDACPHGD